MKKLVLTLLAVLTTSIGFSQTGIFSNQFSSCDAIVQNFLNTYQIPGLSIAISKNGKLVYNRGFGNSNLSLTEPVFPYNLFRLASVSKPITSIAIMKLYQNGQLSMNDKVFGPGGILENHPFFSAANITDNRIYDITVQELLEHSAGWNRDINCFPDPTLPYPWRFGSCDPIVAPLHVAAVNGRPNPANEEDMIYFLLNKGLNFNPGAGYSYSNIGYLILGEIIEQKTNMSYETYVKTQILNPLGAFDMHLGKNLLVDKKEREVEYQGNGYYTLDCQGSGNYALWEYGGFNLEAMTAHGGWIATTKDLLRLITAVDGFASVPDILSAATINLMVAPSANNSNYAKGWAVNSANNWWHTGALDGTATFMARTNGGYTWAVLLNKRIIDSNANNFWAALDALPWNCIASTSTFPAYDLFASPNIATTDVKFQQIDNTTCKINWTNGNGEKRIVVGKLNGDIDKFPVEGSSYTPNNAFGAGANLGDDNFVVYDGTGDNVTVSNLQNGASYTFRVFEYNQNATTGYNNVYLYANSKSMPYYSGCTTITNIPTVLQDLYKSSSFIKSTAILPNYNVKFQATNSIELQPGFKTNSGFIFEAKLSGCN